MTPDELSRLLQELITQWENECVEFKEANDNLKTSEIGKYFSALSNEANLRNSRGGWLVFGIRNRDREIVGTSFRQDHVRLHGLKQDIAQGTDPSSSFREIHEIFTDHGRVLLLEIPAAPKGIPIAWNGHYYARNGESLAALSVDKQDEIRRQEADQDWSAIVVPDATADDLDPAALDRTRKILGDKFSERLPETTVQDWGIDALLDKAKLTIRGKVTRAALLLLGRPESTHLLNPFVAELSWKLEGDEQDYEHFHPPFLLETSRLYNRIRNIRLRLERPGELIPIEFPKYDQRIVLEALHNCIVHQDYTRNERILVIERPGELVFQNAGSFFQGKPEDYILENRTPTRYRNRFLAEAMVNLRMIDTMGFGIREIMFRGQMRRFLPMPDFDLRDPSSVVLRLPGRFIDENYSHLLLTIDDLTLTEAMALDRVQKGLPPSEPMLRSLRKRGLIEGRRPSLHISAKVAAATGDKAGYIRTRGQDDSHYRQLIVDYLENFGEASRKDIRELLMEKLPEVLTAQQKENKIHTLLVGLKRTGQIACRGTRRYAHWHLVKSRSGHSSTDTELERKL